MKYIIYRSEVLLSQDFFSSGLNHSVSTSLSGAKPNSLHEKLTLDSFTDSRSTWSVTTFIFSAISRQYLGYYFAGKPWLVPNGY